MHYCLKYFIPVLLIYLANYACAQKTNKLSVEFGYGAHLYSMKQFNTFYINAPLIKQNYAFKEIKNGPSYNLGIKFKPSGLFDIGISANYQSGHTLSNPVLIETDEFGNPVKTHTGAFDFTVQAAGIGISNAWYVSNLLKFYESESRFLNQFHLSIDLFAGIGFSKITSDLKYPTYPPLYASGYKFYTSKQDFQGQIALKLEYDYLKSPVIGSIGIKAGYQYFRTKTVKDRMGNEWIIGGNHPINLDLSGFFGTVFLTVGK